ncbi:MAG: hypothetical protein GY874_20030 [Desulfobacteraceae bacterium]|nr:hypothetical protein [Desulfobacteraceae bacterium]
MNQKRFFDMKTVLSFLASIILLYGALPVFLLEANPANSVYVIGSSSIHGKNMQAGRKAAIANAFLTAVSRVLMEQVPKELIERNFQAINEEILSQADKYILDFNILNESRHGGEYRLMAQVSVFLKKLNDSLAKAGLERDKQKKSRFLLCVAEKGIDDFGYTYWWDGSGDTQDSIAMQSLFQQLTGAGYDVVQPEADIGSPSYPVQLSSSEAVAMATKVGADIVVTGLATAKETSNTMDGAIRSFRGDLNLWFLRSDTGEQIGMSRKVAISADSDAYAGTRKALANAANLGAKDMISQIRTLGIGFSAGEDKIQVVIEGIGGNIANYVKFRNALGNMSGVKSIQLTEMGSDTTTILADYRGNTKALADALLLQSFDTFGINIIEIGISNIRLQLTPK